MSDSPAARAEAVKQHARELGFDLCGIAAAGPIDPEDRLGAWLASGYHAEMDWMARTKDIRQDVSLRLPGVRSVVVVARNYYHEGRDPAPGQGKVARYAWGRDYHKVLKKPLHGLGEFIKTMETGAQCDYSIDAQPYLERAWAAKAGVGWIGKNSLVLNQDIGSYFFLAVVATTVELQPDKPVIGRCGTCRACIEVCPTQAIVADGVMDSNRCISFQTIENRREIPIAVSDNLEGWVFGCDLCQEVCPWNRFSTETDDPGFAEREGAAYPDLRELSEMDEAAFDERFAGSAIRRAKHAGMQRNARLLLGEE
ncbi:MAG: tRNA epoxyqueuosine(34) reductase QueG [Candidatus Hydrogenedens sp.]|nr:tRNA epoxyqueuosine(34) reductase QueG [Candidatus Hydrogenedens sp.]